MVFEREPVEMIIPELVRGLNRVTSKDWQNLIACCGTTGVGKSTFVLECAMAGDKNFTLQRNVLFNPTFEEVFTLIKDLPFGAHIILDEAVNLIYKMYWYDEKTKLLAKLLRKCRKDRKTIYFCIPDFDDIAKSVKNNINMWIQIIKRGRAVVLSRNPLFTSARWEIKLLDKLFKKFFKMKRFYEIDALEVLYVCRRIQYYMGEIVFPKLDLRIESEYEIMRDKEKYDDIIKGLQKSTNKDTIKKLIFALFYLGLTQDEIGKLISRAPNTIGYALDKTRDKVKSQLSVRLNVIINKTKTGRSKSLRPEMKQMYRNGSEGLKENAK